MSDLFSTPASVFMGSSSRAKPLATIFVDGRSIDNEIELTSIQGRGEANIQVDSTFKGEILITAFGQKIVPINIMGVARTVTCSSETSSSRNINDFYKSYNAGDKVDTPVIRVVFANNIFEGFLVGLALSPYSDGSVSLPAYSFQLTIIGGIK